MREPTNQERLFFRLEAGGLHQFLLQRAENRSAKMIIVSSECGGGYLRSGFGRDSSVLSWCCIAGWKKGENNCSESFKGAAEY